MPDGAPIGLKPIDGWVYFAFLSVCTNFDFVEVRLHLGQENKSRFILLSSRFALTLPLRGEVRLRFGKAKKLRFILLFAHLALTLQEISK